MVGLRAAKRRPTSQGRSSIRECAKKDQLYYSWVVKPLPGVEPRTCWLRISSLPAPARSERPNSLPTAASYPVAPVWWPNLARRGVADLRIQREPSRGSAPTLYLLIEVGGTVHYARGWRAILSVARSLRCNGCEARPCICPTPAEGLTRALSAARAAVDSDEPDERCPTCLSYEAAASIDDASRVAELEEDLDSLEAARSALAEQVQDLLRERDELAAVRAECIEQLDQISALAGVPFDTDAPQRFARDLRGAIAGAVQLADARLADMRPARCCLFTSTRRAFRVWDRATETESDGRPVLAWSPEDAVRVDLAGSQGAQYMCVRHACGLVEAMTRRANGDIVATIARPNSPPPDPPDGPTARGVIGGVDRA